MYGICPSVASLEPCWKIEPVSRAEPAPASRTCFDAENYGALLMVDLEDELGEGEKIKLEEDVYEKGLSLVVFADWYSEDVMSRVRESRREASHVHAPFRRVLDSAYNRTAR